MNYILEYWEAIESGKVVTSRRVRAVYERLAREIREPDPASPYYFDEDVGERPILFAERFLQAVSRRDRRPSQARAFPKGLYSSPFRFP